MAGERRDSPSLATAFGLVLKAQLTEHPQSTQVMNLGN